MILVLSREGMLERRRLSGGFEPCRTDSTTADSYGVDVDTLLERQMRERYLEFLDKGDVSLLQVDERSQDGTVATYVDGGAVVTPGQACRRVLRVRMDGWSCAADVLPESEFERVLACQRNPYTSADTCSPVAVAGGDGKVYAWPGSDSIVELLCICDPGRELYVLDERAVGIICKSDCNPLI